MESELFLSFKNDNLKQMFAETRIPDINKISLKVLTIRIVFLIVEVISNSIG